MAERPSFHVSRFTDYWRQQVARWMLANDSGRITGNSEKILSVQTVRPSAVISDRGPTLSHPL